MNAEITKKYSRREQPLQFEWQANARVRGEARRGGENKELTLSFPTLSSRVSLGVPLAGDFSRYPLNGDLDRRLLGFHCCERWLDRHHSGSVNSKCTDTPKRICQVLTSAFALDIRARAGKIAQTLYSSQTRRFQSLLRNLSPIFGRKKGKINNLLPNWKVFLCCVVLKC